MPWKAAAMNIMKNATNIHTSKSADIYINNVIKHTCIYIKSMVS